ncbi:MAG: hypothetical protein LBD15_02685 [Holosporales bacterium]|jgi:hypothetical protein|nr:hypothetical protein [Holosporales bacterium]
MRVLEWKDTVDEFISCIEDNLEHHHSYAAHWGVSPEDVERYPKRYLLREDGKCKTRSSAAGVDLFETLAGKFASPPVKMKDLPQCAKCLITFENPIPVVRVELEESSSGITVKKGYTQQVICVAKTISFNKQIIPTIHPGNVLIPDPLLRSAPVPSFEFDFHRILEEGPP